MTRAERIAQSHATQGAWSVIRAHGTAAQIERGAYYSARGRFSDITALGAQIATTVPASAYALASR